MITVGIDIGSVATKTLILKDNNILSTALGPTKADPNLAAELTMEEVLRNASLSRDDIAYVVSTGYGRRTIGFGDKAVTEITANARGSTFLGCPYGSIGTIIDLGGQDSKVISLEDDCIVDFVMNDKCSAGTGRFLEVMAHILGVDLEELGELSLKSKNPVKLNSTCTVFAESEIISLIAQRKGREDIIAGLHETIARKLAGMVRQLGIREAIFFSGGGAKNPGIRKALENELGVRLYVPKEPEFVTALGAALIASEFSSKSK